MPSKRVESALSSARNCFSVTPSDSGPLAAPTKGLYVGTAGDLAVRTGGSQSDVIFRNVPAGMVLDIEATHVRATGTTAAAIVGMA